MTKASRRLIAERERTHGPFAETALLAENLKTLLQSNPKWPTLSVRHREALSMIATKMARIICGDPDFPDHWRDIDGYAVLGAGDDAPERGQAGAQHGEPLGGAQHGEPLGGAVHRGRSAATMRSPWR